MKYRATFEWEPEVDELAESGGDEYGLLSMSLMELGITELRLTEVPEDDRPPPNTDPRLREALDRTLD